MRNKRKAWGKERTGLVIIITLLIVLYIVCIFSNFLMCTPKAYADKTVNKGISYVNELFKKSRDKTRDLINSMPEYDNFTYTAEFHIDKRFAYENNFPYFEKLSASATNFTDPQDDTTYNSMELISNDKVLLDVNAAAKEGKTILSIPDFISGYYLTSDNTKTISDVYELEEEDENDYDEQDDEYYDVYDILGVENPNKNDLSLFSYMLKYSSLDPDSFGDLSACLLSDLFASFPEDCYLVSFGPVDKSDVTISVTEPELAKAIAYVINKNVDNPDFKQMFVSAFPDMDYEAFIKDFIEGIKGIECFDQNIYTINFKTGLFGSLKELTLSYIYEGEYRSFTASLYRNRILITINDNSKFQDEVQEYNTKALEITYGVSPDKSVKGYVQYMEETGAILIYFDGVKPNNGFIDGNISIIRTDDEQLSIHIDSTNKSASISYDREGESLAYLNINKTDCPARPFEWEDLAEGNRYSNISEYIEELFSSEKISELGTELQLDQFEAWLKPYYEEAS